MPRFLLALPFLFISLLSVAQTDSVTISGRILNLTPRLYRQSPNVLISRNNLLQPDAELTRPALLNPDGTFSVKMPVLFPQEEMYFSFASVSTAFLAAPGQLTIDLNADSLFRAAIPFQFGGANARVNAQYARYKAFEAKQPKLDNERLSQQVSRQEFPAAFSRISATYNEPFGKFTQTEKPFPLTQQWVTGVNRDNAASFLYDMASAQGRVIPRAMDDSLRPANNPILTAARAVSVARMANYAIQIQPGGNQSLPIDELASLLLQYSPSLTETERTNLKQWQQAKAAKVNDLRQMQRIMARNADTLQRLMNYQLLINQAKIQFGSLATQTLTAYWMANSLPMLTLDRARLLYAYARPRLEDARIITSLNELYAMAVSDSVRIRRAVAQIKPTMGLNKEISPGVFVSRNDEISGGTLLKSWLGTNRSELVYLLLWSPEEEAQRRMVVQAQQLRDTYAPNELTVLYVALPTTDPNVWSEHIVRNNLKGDHFLLTRLQYETMPILYGLGTTGAMLLDRTGKVVKANVSLPDDPEGLRKQVEKRLK
jgi:hypothetical protein